MYINMNIFFQFGLNWDIYIIKTDGSFIRTTVTEILPMAFTPEQLQKQWCLFLLSLKFMYYISLYEISKQIL